MKHIATSDQPLIEAIAKLSPESSKTTLRSWLKEGRITVDGQIVKIGSTPVLIGQEIVLGAKPRYIEGGIRIYHEDQHLVVIDKPAGLLSVATDYEKGKTAHGILKDHYRPKRVFVIHRLDQDTSGVMLFAFTEEARDRLKAIFEEHAIERVYFAIVEGQLKQHSGSWQSYLYEDDHYVVHSTIDPDKGQIAVTHYNVISSSKRSTAVKLKLETGRKNQIRVHCQDAGHPVMGDKKYGAATNPLKRLCLHAHILAFEHPITKKALRFESPIPEEFQKLISNH